MNKNNSDNQLKNPLSQEQQERVAELRKDINFAKIKRFRIRRLVSMVLLFLSGFILGPVGLWLGISFHLADAITITMLPIIIVASVLVGGGIGGFIFTFIVYYLKNSPTRGITSGRYNNLLPTAKRASGVIVDIFYYHRGVTAQQERDLVLANELRHIADSVVSPGGAATLLGREATGFQDLSGTGGSKYIALIYSQELDKLFLTAWDNGNGYGNGSETFYFPILFDSVKFYYDPKNSKWAWIEGESVLGQTGRGRRDNLARLRERQRVDAELGTKGESRLEFELQDYYTRQIKTKDEVAEIERLVNEGDVQAQILFACMHMFGDGVKKNNKKAEELLILACEQNGQGAWEVFELFSRFGNLNAVWAFQRISKRRAEIESADFANRKNT